MSFNSKYTGAQVEAWLDNIKNYSANDILTKLKTVDGAGSGLDADLLNGKTPSELNVGSSDVSGRLLTGAGASVNANELTHSDWSIRWYSNLPSSSTNLPATNGYQNGILTLPLHSNGSTAQLAMSVAKKLYYRSHQTYDWNEIAYVTDNVASATKASQDGDGNVISSTYLKKQTYTITVGGQQRKDITSYYETNSGAKVAVITLVYGNYSCVFLVYSNGDRIHRVSTIENAANVILLEINEGKLTVYNKASSTYTIPLSIVYLY